MSAGGQGDGPTAIQQSLPRDDPTRTKTLRKRYGSQIYRMYLALKGAVRQYVIEENRFGMNYPQPNSAALARHAAAEGGTIYPTRNAGIPGVPDPLDLPDVRPPASPSWDFPQDRKKVSEFMNWFRNAQESLLLRPSEGLANGEIWADEYVRYSYYRGLEFAENAMESSGFIDRENTRDILDTFQMPVHRDALGLIFQRQYDGLEGIGNETSKQLSRILSEGFAAGDNPRTIATEINDRIDKIGITRGRTLARTEIIRTYNEASLNRFEQIRGSDATVELFAEFGSAQDSRVCPICQGLDGKKFRLKDAHNVIPQHPNCRCAWIPVQRSVPAAASAANRELAQNIHEVQGLNIPKPDMDMREAFEAEAAG